VAKNSQMAALRSQTAQCIRNLKQICQELINFIKLAVFSGKHNITVWHPSVRTSVRIGLSVCLSSLLSNLNGRTAYTQRDSPGSSTLRVSVHFHTCIVLKSLLF